MKYLTIIALLAVTACGPSGPISTEYRASEYGPSKKNTIVTVGDFHPCPRANCGEKTMPQGSPK